MLRVGAYDYKFADTDEEVEQVHRLNYRTFVHEIPQHPDTGTGQLVDKFHGKNRYLVALKDGAVVGMLSACDEPPFSVASRLPDPAVLSAPGVRPVEIRLMAVEPGERHSAVTMGLVWALYKFAAAAGYTHFVISGVSSQRRFHLHLGFEPLGPAVASGGAKFTPMWLPLGRLEETMGKTVRRLTRRFEQDAAVTLPSAAATVAMTRPAETVCLLPGPVAIAPAVTAAFREPIQYHRADDFIPYYEGVRGRLSGLVGGKPVGLFVGSGTLANEAVAATLSADPARGNGLVLVNGEFGDRLRKQAARWNLAPRVRTWDWGRAWQLDEVEADLKAMPPGGWVWGAHHETSTGVLNDLPGLVELAKRYGHRVCADCVSSLATVPLDLSGVYLGTGASGKAVGSYAGLAFVFADPADLAHLDTASIPTYLDVAATVGTTGPRFTVPSPLVAALAAALDPLSTPAGRAARFTRVRELGEYLRAAVVAAGLAPLAPASVASPAIVTFAPPHGESAAAFAQRCREWGYQIAGQSGYLAERRMVQLAVMGDLTREQLAPLAGKLAGLS